jgi:hypothetical protein
MTPETDDNGSNDGGPRSTQHASPIIAGAAQIRDDLESIGHEVQSAPAATPAARGREDALWAGLATTVAVGSMLWIAYQSNVQNEVTLVQRQIEAQHDEFVTELQSLKDKIQGMTAAQSRTDAQIAKLVEQSQPPKSEFQGLQNHVNTLRGQPKQRKK